MATCLQCGEKASFWSLDIFTRVCQKCRASGTRPATLGCGTLLLIGIVVAVFSRPGLSDLESQVSHLQSTVEELKKLSKTQTNEIRELRAVIEEQRKGGVGKDK